MMIIELGKFTLLTTMARIQFSQACEHSNKLPQFCVCVSTDFQKVLFLSCSIYFFCFLPLTFRFLQLIFELLVFFLLSLPQKNSDELCRFLVQLNKSQTYFTETENQTKWVIFFFFNNWKVDRLNSVPQNSNISK